MKHKCRPHRSGCLYGEAQGKGRNCRGQYDAQGIANRILLRQVFPEEGQHQAVRHQARDSIGDQCARGTPGGYEQEAQAQHDNQPNPLRNHHKARFAQHIERRLMDRHAQHAHHEVERQKNREELARGRVFLSVERDHDILRVKQAEDQARRGEQRLHFDQGLPDAREPAIVHAHKSCGQSCDTHAAET